MQLTRRTVLRSMLAAVPGLWCHLGTTNQEPSYDLERLVSIIRGIEGRHLIVYKLACLDIVIDKIQPVVTPLISESHLVVFVDHKSDTFVEDQLASKWLLNRKDGLVFLFANYPHIKVVGASRPKS